MTDSLYIGIDPGKTGGVAIVDNRGRVLRVVKMPDTDAELLAALDGFPALVDFRPFVARAAVERVNAGAWGRPGARMGVVSAFTFGGEYRRVQTALTAKGIPFDLVMPVKWQAALSCLSGGDKRIPHKRAAQLFPKISVTRAIADALLIAEYCRRLDTGRLDISAKGVRHGKTK